MPGKLGPAVIGREAYEREQRELDQPTKLGAAVTGGHSLAGRAAGQDIGPSEERPTSGPVSEGADALADLGVSVDELRSILAAEPGQVETFLQIELARAEGPRKEALLALLEAEQQRPEGPDAEIVRLIEEHL